VTAVAPASASDTLTGHLGILADERVTRRRAFAPPPRITVSEWADRYRVLSAESTPGEHGRWRTARAPYLREIMDALSDPTVERVVFMKSARVGATETLNNWLGFSMDLQPGPMLIIQPTVDDAKGWSKEQLAPMLRDCGRLRGKIKESGRRDAKNALQFKQFPGGYLAVVGSNAASGFRRRSIEKLGADEVDGYGREAKGGVNKEGDPLSLAIKRTNNAWRRKIFECSTPTVKGASRIEDDFLLSDQRHYYVPCPHCGHRQTLKWGQFRWDDRDAATVRYVCGGISPDGELTAGCGEPITEEHKTWMVTRGEWRAHQPGRRLRGYFIWSGYSLLSGWERMVAEFLEAKATGKAALQVFVNTVLGETWDESGERIDHGALAARRQAYPEGVDVPMGAAVLGCGTDTQGDRLEYSVWAWGAGEEAWLIKHETLWGDPGQPEVWRQLDLVRNREWRHASGAMLKIRAMAIDSGGHHTSEVYRYVKARRGHGVFAIKGGTEPGRAPVSRPSKSNKEAVQLFTLGVDALKDTWFSRLKLDAEGPGYVHFPMVDDEYLRQLTAETARTRYVNKRPVRRYEKVYERNEALDCAVYALAALYLLGPVRDQLDKEVAKLAALVKPKPSPAPLQGIQPPSAAHRPPSRGGFVNSWRR
jgi:phage terminase large subunit GpA-like protein